MKERRESEDSGVSLLSLFKGFFFFLSLFFFIFLSFFLFLSSFLSSFLYFSFFLFLFLSFFLKVVREREGLIKYSFPPARFIR